MKRGEAVLFLGAGASFGAKRAGDEVMPLGDTLRDLVCDRFLASTCKDRSIDEVASLAETTAGRAELDQFVANAVRGFEPTSAHLLLPKFRWKAVFGTNYDLLVEAGWNATTPLQTLKPIFRDTGIERDLATVVDPLPYYKLHGTIDYLHDPATPLILTQDSYLTYRQNRKRLFGRFEDLAREMPSCSWAPGSRTTTSERSCTQSMPTPRPGLPTTSSARASTSSTSPFLAANACCRLRRPSRVLWRR